MRPTNETRRYNVTASFIGSAHTQNDPCILCMPTANETRRYNITASLTGWTHTQNDPYRELFWCLLSGWYRHPRMYRSKSDHTAYRVVTLSRVPCHQHRAKCHAWYHIASYHPCEKLIWCPTHARNVYNHIMFVVSKSCQLNYNSTNLHTWLNYTNNDNWPWFVHRRILVSCILHILISYYIGGILCVNAFQITNNLTVCLADYPG